MVALGHAEDLEMINGFLFVAPHSIRHHMHKTQLLQNIELKWKSNPRPSFTHISKTKFLPWISNPRPSFTHAVKKYVQNQRKLMRYVRTFYVHKYVQKVYVLPQCNVIQGRQKNIRIRTPKIPYVVIHLLGSSPIICTYQDIL